LIDFSRLRVRRAREYSVDTAKYMREAIRSLGFAIDELQSAGREEEAEELRKIQGELIRLNEQQIAIFRRLDIEYRW